MAKKKAKKTVKKAAPKRAINDSIKDAIKYPWAKMQRVFWLLLLIFGAGLFNVIQSVYVSIFDKAAWQASGVLWSTSDLLIAGVILVIPTVFLSFPIWGYMLDFMQAIVKGNDKNLPKFGKYRSSLVPGFYYFVFTLIFLLVFWLLYKIPVVGFIGWIYLILIVPILYVNYAVKRKFKAFFDIGFATKLVFGHIIEYILLILKVIVVTLFWLICSIPIITMIWTLPAMQVSSQFLLAQFYRKYR